MIKDKINDDKEEIISFKEELKKCEFQIIINFCNKKTQTHPMEIGESLILNKIKKIDCDNSTIKEIEIKHYFKNLQKISNISFSYFRLNEQKTDNQPNDIKNFINREENKDISIAKIDTILKNEEYYFFKDFESFQGKKRILINDKNVKNNFIKEIKKNSTIEDIASPNSKSKKIFTCDFVDCKKIYKSKENLNLHNKNIHLKEKPYSCKYCERNFSHRNGKTYHERKFHTKFLPYKCTTEKCRFEFASKSSLNCHIKSNHLCENKRILISKKTD